LRMHKWILVMAPLVSSHWLPRMRSRCEYSSCSRYIALCTHKIYLVDHFTNL
jgi:hypothetical protein